MKGALRLSPFTFHPSDDEFVEITVADTGIGIPAQHLHHIFERFYQVDNSHTREHSAPLDSAASTWRTSFDSAYPTGQGAGIGLALVKELVALHRGTIAVQSEVGKGTQFVVRLPLGKRHFKPEELAANDEEQGMKSEERKAKSEERKASAMQPGSSIEQPASSDSDIVLLIEDHTEMRSFIRERLEPAYKIFEAADGHDGLETAREVVPDLIICDVMMPQRDGFELCPLLKNDARTSHIPIIFLTAKAGEDSKIQGLQTGADDYLTKPFSAKELRAQVKNLIDSRRRLRERFSRELILQPGKIAATSMDEQFLQRVLAVVEKHLEEEDFNVETLAREAGMSRTQLHRKLRALTNRSASELIRTLRLQRAADLLKQNAGTVTEIAYRVGFSSPTYFAKCFKEHFGHPPGELKNGENGSRQK